MRHRYGGCVNLNYLKIEFIKSNLYGRLWDSHSPRQQLLVTGLLVIGLDVGYNESSQGTRSERVQSLRPEIGEFWSRRDLRSLLGVGGDSSGATSKRS